MTEGDDKVPVCGKYLCNLGDDLFHLRRTKHLSSLFFSCQELLPFSKWSTYRADTHTSRQESGLPPDCTASWWWPWGDSLQHIKACMHGVLSEAVGRGMNHFPHLATSWKQPELLFKAKAMMGTPVIVTWTSVNLSHHCVDWSLDVETSAVKKQDSTWTWELKTWDLTWNNDDPKSLFLFLF